MKLRCDGYVQEYRIVSQSRPNCAGSSDRTKVLRRDWRHAYRQGVIVDVTERKLVESALAEAREHESAGRRPDPAHVSSWVAHPPSWTNSEVSASAFRRRESTGISMTSSSTPTAAWMLLSETLEGKGACSCWQPAARARSSGHCPTFDFGFSFASSPRTRGITMKCTMN